MVYGYAFSRDAESWAGRYESREAAVEAALREEPDAASVYTCEGRDIDLLKVLVPDAERVWEDAEERVGESYPFVDDFIFHPLTAEQRAFLTVGFELVFESFLERFPQAYRRWHEAKNITQHIVVREVRVIDEIRVLDAVVES